MGRYGHVRRVVIAVIATMLLSAAVAGCSGDQEGEQAEDTASGADTAAAGVDEDIDLRLGGILSLTGSLSSYGPQWAQAANFAIAEIQQAVEELGLEDSYQVSITIEDDQSQPTGAVEAARKLVDIDNVPVIIGSDLSANNLPVAQTVTIPNEVVQIAVNGAGSKLRNLEDDNFVWAMTGNEIMVSHAMARLVGEKLGPTATVNVIGENEEYGVTVMGSFEELWLDGGGRIGAQILLDPKAPSYDTEAQQIVRDQPDGWNISVLPPTAAKLFPALIRTGQWDPERTIVNEALRNGEELQEIGGDALNGLVGHTPTSVGAPAREALDELFEREAPDLRVHGFDGTAFDAVMCAFLASVKAGSTESAMIRDQLRAISGPPGTKYTFLELTEAIRDLRDGKDIDYEGTFGSVNWDEQGDISPPWLYEEWMYEDGDTPLVEGFVIE